MERVLILSWLSSAVWAVEEVQSVSFFVLTSMFYFRLFCLQFIFKLHIFYFFDFWTFFPTCQVRSLDFDLLLLLPPPPPSSFLLLRLLLFIPSASSGCTGLRLDLNSKPPAEHKIASSGCSGPCLEPNIEGQNRCQKGCQIECRSMSDRMPKNMWNRMSE